MSIFRQPRIATLVTLLAALLALALIVGVKNASSATTPIANRAFSGFSDRFIDLPTSLTAAPIATLNIPVAGNYVINAKLEARNFSSSPSPVDICGLQAGGDSDAVDFDLEGTRSVDEMEAVALQVVHRFNGPGAVTLRCVDSGVGLVRVNHVKITAVQVAELTNTPI